MGADQCHYVIVGAKFTWEEFDEAAKEVFGDNWSIAFDEYDDNAYSEHVTSCGGVTMVRDGMDCQYIVMGLCYHKASEFDGLEMIDCIDAMGYMHEAEEKIAAVFEKKGMHLPFRVGVWAFTHWH